jgi:plasmid replication initiation protein
MVTNTPKIDPHLLPDRYPQQELFICDVADAVLKDVMQHMEHPFYSLSKKPDVAIRRYEHHGNYIEITPSVKGLATIYDKDILIYCISQIMEKLKRGEKVNQRVRINSHDLLVFTNRGTGGKDYKALSESLDRLAGTRIKTNIRSGDEEQEDNFGLIDASSIKRTHGLDGRLIHCEIKLSDWVFNAIRAQEVLTLHPDYFRLRKPLERRIYEVARKHCGQQGEWSIFLDNLHKKTGSRSPMKRFRQLVKDLAFNDHLPDYSVKLEEDKVTFLNKKHHKKAKSSRQIAFLDDMPMLSQKALDDAKAAAPGYDIYYLEQEWKNWWSESGKPDMRNPEKAFIGFCKSRYERNPNP